MNFTFPLTKIMFGDGMSGQVGAVMRGFRCKKVMLIYDPGIKEAGIVKPIIEAMRLSNLQVVEYGKVQVSVPLSSVREAAAVAKEAEIDGLVAVGGGSAMDTGKAVNVALTQRGDLLDYVGTLDAGVVFAPLLKPYVCIPTTAGTGSEVSPVAVIYDERDGVKKALPQIENVPRTAIVDPLLHLKMPPGLTASSGLDALAHAIEGIGGYTRNPMLTAWGLKVCELIFSNLPIAVADGSNLEARSNMAMAATFAIMVGAYGGFHLPHALGHSIEALTHMSHGITCAFAMPEICEYYADLIPAETRALAAMLGVKSNGGRPIAEVGAEFRGALRQFYVKMGCPKAQKVIPNPADIDRIIELALGEYTFMTAPKKPNRAELTQMLQSAYASLS
ncbi:MAG: iron-containing alcohol dehydrogenase [Desulfobacteraceae bacterium]|nr:iron-containing alcohol dehydrogenase [Desulfobacteraceae bacterium]